MLQTCEDVRPPDFGLRELPRLTKTERVIMWRMVDQRAVCITEFIDALYGGRDDGGPLTADNLIRVRMCTLRHKMRDAGLSATIKSDWRSRYYCTDPDELRGYLARELDLYGPSSLQCTIMAAADLLELKLLEMRQLENKSGDLHAGRSLANRAA